MKKFIFVLGLIASLLSCNKLETLNTYEAKEIVFSNNLKKTPEVPITRAIVHGTSLSSNFGVYGYVKPTDDVTTGGYIMKNGEYKPDGTSDIKYYWPKAGNNDDINVKFVAYYPFEPNSSSKIEMVGDDFVYHITTNSVLTEDKANDVLWAIANNQHPTLINTPGALDSNNDVTLTFEHALALVQFQAKMSPLDANSNGITAVGKAMCIRAAE